MTAQPLLALASRLSGLPPAQAQYLADLTMRIAGSRLVPSKIGYLMTGNEDKEKEFNALLPKGYNIAIADLPVPELQYTSGQRQQVKEAARAGTQAPYSFAAVAADISREKAMSAFILNGGKPTLVDDTSLFICCLRGRPGIYVADVSDEEDLAELCVQVDRLGPHHPAGRQAVWITTLAAYNGVDTKAEAWIGVSCGTISPEPKGNFGFGFDRIFVPDGIDKTLAELAEGKSLYSARVKAINALSSRPLRVPQELAIPF